MLFSAAVYADPKLAFRRLVLLKESTLYFETVTKKWNYTMKAV